MGVHNVFQTRVWIKNFQALLQGLFPKLAVLFEACSHDMYTSLVYLSPASTIIHLLIHFLIVAYPKYL